MTSIVDGRADLVTALTGAGIRATEDLGGVAVPCVIVSGSGVDVGHIGRGQVAAGYRLALLSGAWDAAGASRGLAALTDDVLAVLRALEGFAVGDVTADTIIRVAGSDLYGAFIPLRRLADVT